MVFGVCSLQPLYRVAHSLFGNTLSHVSLRQRDQAIFYRLKLVSTKFKEAFAALLEQPDFQLQLVLPEPHCQGVLIPWLHLNRKCVCTLIGPSSKEICNEALQLVCAPGSGVKHVYLGRVSAMAVHSLSACQLLTSCTLSPIGDREPVLDLQALGPLPCLQELNLARGWYTGVVLTTA